MDSTESVALHHPPKDASTRNTSLRGSDSLSHNTERIHANKYAVWKEKGTNHKAFRRSDLSGYGTRGQERGVASGFGAQPHNRP